MSTVAARITPEELLHLPDEGVRYELVDGELRERNVSKESSSVGAAFVAHLYIWCVSGNRGWVYGSDLGFRCFENSHTVRFPDVSFVSLARMPLETYEDEGYCGTVPDLVVEVVSPNDLASEVESKCLDWLAAGVRTVWIAYPNTKSLHVYRNDGSTAAYKIGDTLADASVLPGFSVPVAELFRKTV